MSGPVRSHCELCGTPGTIYDNVDVYGTFLDQSFEPDAPLLPDDDTAVERLATALWRWKGGDFPNSGWKPEHWRQEAERIIECLREGGLR